MIIKIMLSATHNAVRRQQRSGMLQDDTCLGF